MVDYLYVSLWWTCEGPVQDAPPPHPIPPHLSHSDCSPPQSGKEKATIIYNGIFFKKQES